jgi:uncharacterized protein (TIGR02594 family)
MELTRRIFLLATAAAAAASVPARAQTGIDWSALATADTVPPLIPDSLASVAAQPSLNDVLSGTTPFGTHPPTSQETATARRVLDAVPRGKTPVEIALYFLEVAQGKYGRDLQPYTTAWPVDWNPVIVEFFTTIHDFPQGDTTAWCSAFVNYCLIASLNGTPPPAGGSRPTMDAGSRSFRTWGTQTSTPQPGDVAVFVNQSSPGHGHVGFFLADQGTSVLVLGGNQFDGTPVRHCVCRKAIPKNSRTGGLKLHSYRTDKTLHA